MHRIIPEPRHLKEDGIEVTVIFQRGQARIDIVTTYVMEEALRWELMLILKDSAFRARTRPQMGPQGGFCTHIDPSRAMRAAYRILRRARRDQLSALHEEIRLPKAYVQ